MIVTLDIRDSKAAAFLNFIQSLDFVKIKQEENLKLTSKQKIAIDEGLKQVEEQKTTSHAEAMDEMKRRHPKY